MSEDETFYYMFPSEWKGSERNRYSGAKLVCTTNLAIIHKHATTRSSLPPSALKTLWAAKIVGMSAERGSRSARRSARV